MQSSSRILRGFGKLLQFGDFLEDIVRKANNLTETNYQLALKMAREGRNKDAIFRFRITLWLAPNHEPSMYNLACLYQHQGEYQRALALLQRLIKNNPRHSNAIYRVACIDPSLLKEEMRPATVPPVQVSEYFDTLAPYYDAACQEERYRLPTLTYELLTPILKEDGPKRDLLDIGCGTGLVGHVLAGQFVNTVGVDMSAQMQDTAYRRVDSRGIRIYSQLLHEDVRHLLARKETQSFDAATLIDVLPYIGDLSLLASQFGQKIRPGGIVALSFTPHPHGITYGVLPATSYFAHTLDYVNQSLGAHGFSNLRHGEVEARSGQFAQLCLYRKNA